MWGSVRAYPSDPSENTEPYPRRHWSCGEDEASEPQTRLQFDQLGFWHGPVSSSDADGTEH